MKSPTRIALIAAVAMLCAVRPAAAQAGGLARANTAAPVPLATVLTVQSHLTVVSGTKSHQVNTPPHLYPLNSGDELGLVKSQKASIRYCNTTEVDLRGVSITGVAARTPAACGSVLAHFSAVGQRARLQAATDPGIVTTVQKGEIFEFVPDQASGLVQTAAASADGSGSSFDVRVAGSASTFTCVQGQITVQGATGDTVQLGAGQQVTVVAGQAIGPVNDNVDTAAVVQWTNSLPSPGPLRADQQLLGNWVNSNLAQGGITYLSFRPRGATVTAQATYLCQTAAASTTSCSTKQVPANLYSTTTVPNDGVAFTVTFAQGNLTMLVTGYLQDGYLEVTSFYTISNAGNTSYLADFAEFQKLPAPTANGPGLRSVAQAMKVRSRALSPDPGLLGDWTTSDDSSNGLVKLGLQNSQGNLSAQAYGACSPDPCDWGAVPATAYGWVASPDSGTAFTAQFQVSGDTTLVTGDLEGANLVVTSFTKAQPGSGEPNTFAVKYFDRVQSSAPA